MTKAIAKEDVRKGLENVDPNKFMLARYYGTFVVPDTHRLDKKKEQRFKVTIVVPKSLLKHNFNFHSHFKYTQKQAFAEKYPEFIRFKNVVLDYATELDGTEIRDWRTFSIERLKAFCTEKEFGIDFDLYPGLQLRSLVHEYFLRPDRRDESQAFYRKQEHDRKVRGLNAELRAESESIPANVRIQFEEV